MSGNVLSLNTGGSQSRDTTQLATIAAVYTDGVTLIFDGQSEASSKHYKCNTAVPFAAGDRVKVCEIAGTFVVEYVVGAPLAVQALSTASANMGYTAATSSNYLRILNNIAGILKKYKLIT